MKILLPLFLVALSFVGSASAQTAKISAKDLKPLEGKQWVGELTYLDYQSKKPTSIKSNVTITRKPHNNLKWTFAMQYLLEPKADRTEDIVLSAYGSVFDGESVVERTKLPDGTLKIVTTASGKDDDREATFRHTYIVGKKVFSIRKDVKFKDESDYFERNTYSWKR